MCMLYNANEYFNAKLVRWEQNSFPIFLFVYLLKQGFFVTQVVLELALETRLTSNLEIHLPLPPEYWN